MRSTKTAESGFTLLETVVVVAVVAIVGLGAVGAVAAIGKNGEPQTNRNLALMVARKTFNQAAVLRARLDAIEAAGLQHRPATPPLPSPCRKPKPSTNSLISQALLKPSRPSPNASLAPTTTSLPPGA